MDCGSALQLMILTCFILPVINQHLELANSKWQIRFPYPFVALNVFQWDTSIPAQIRPLAPDTDRVAKADIEFDHHAGSWPFFGFIWMNLCI